MEILGEMKYWRLINPPCFFVYRKFFIAAEKLKLFSFFNVLQTPFCTSERSTRFFISNKIWTATLILEWDHKFCNKSLPVLFKKVTFRTFWQNWKGNKFYLFWQGFHTQIFSRFAVQKLLNVKLLLKAAQYCQYIMKL